MGTIEAAMEETPVGTPTIIGSGDGESADVTSIDGIYNDGNFFINLDDDSRFRVDVVRVG